MTEEINNKPLTVKDIREVLIPAMVGVFATKQDLEALFTKKDAEKFATKQDLQGLLTKKEFEAFRKTAMEVFTTKQDLKELKTNLKEEMSEKFDKVLTSSENIVSRSARPCS